MPIDAGAIYMSYSFAMKSSRVAIVLFASLVSGCGGGDPNRGAVRGTITIDGKPVTQGTVDFMPIDRSLGSTAGTTIEDGKYDLARIKGATVGKNRVVVAGSLKFAEPDSNPPELGGEPGIDLPEEFYRSWGFRRIEYEDDPSLIVDIQPGKNQFDFHLRSVATE